MLRPHFTEILNPVHDVLHLDRSDPPAMRPGMWYPVVERNPAADNEEARPGYVWIDLGTGAPLRHVWARHLEISDV